MISAATGDGGRHRAPAHGREIPPFTGRRLLTAGIALHTLPGIEHLFVFREGAMSGRHETTSGKEQTARGAATGASPALVRWECRCRLPPVLLATYDARGRIHIKARDRYWHVDGTVQTVCPRCGSEHTLDLRRGGDGESASRGVEKSRSRAEIVSRQS